MAVAFFLVWDKKIKDKKDKSAIIIFFVQLVLNSLWSIIFFGLKMPGLAFLEIMVLWLTIFLVIKSFWKINKTSGILLLPYLLWVSFASILNFSVWILNR